MPVSGYFCTIDVTSQTSYNLAVSQPGSVPEEDAIGGDGVQGQPKLCAQLGSSRRLQTAAALTLKLRRSR